MAANPQAKSPQLIWLQQRAQYYHKYYRRGDSEKADAIVTDGHPEDVAAARRLVQPTPGRWRGLRGIDYQNRVLKRLLLKERYEHMGNNRPDVDDEDAAEVTGTLNKIAKTVWRGQLKYVKALGWGGVNLATLWECTHRNGRRTFIVMKTPFEKSMRAEIRVEKNWLTILARAPHILQRVYIKELRSLEGEVAARVVAGQPAARHTRGGTARTLERIEGDIDKDTGFVLLEYMKHGNLDVVIKRLEVFRDQWDNQFTEDEFNQFLWHLFDCLIKACIAMELPPRYQNPNEEDIIGAPLPEIIPPLNVKQPWEIVHFDLDPQNVLIRGFDNATHNQIPQFAVSDFGGCLQEGNVVNDRMKLWSRRVDGKYGFHFPEQFTKEWDAVDIFPTPQEVVAGRFSYKSNIYQVGQILWCFITLLRPNDPPICSEITYGPDNHRRTRWSWGYEVYKNENGDFDRVDEELRLLVARCMFNEPAQRPGLSEIQGIVLGNLTPDAGNRWRTFFGNPRLPTRLPFDITRRRGQPVPKIDPFA